METMNRRCLLELTYQHSRHLGWVSSATPPAFISTEEGVSPTTIIITSQIFTGFSHGYKRQRFNYDIILLVKGNPPRSARSPLIPIDSGAGVH